MSPERPKSVSVLGNAAWGAAGTLVTIVVTFLLAPLLIRRLGIEQWGLLLLVWSLSGALAVANFGLGEASLRFIARHHADGNLAGVNRVLGATLTFYLVVCLAAVAVLWAAAPWVAQWVKVPVGAAHPTEWLIRLTALLFSAAMLANAFGAIPMALQRYDISTKVGSFQTIIRSVGLVLLALTHFGVLALVVWEVLVGCAAVVARVAVARKMIPGLRCLPSLSLDGLREIIGYSMFSFATHVFLTAWREGPRLLLGTRVGPAGVAHLGTPDSVCSRLHSVVVSAVETLVPRFSTLSPQDRGRALLEVATWSAFACGTALYLPLAVLMPDFLRLWISREFATHSGTVGTVLTLSLIAPTGYAAIATLLRGIGKPAFVTVTMAAAAIVVLAASLLLVPSLSVMGVAWAYLIAAVAWLGGLTHGWLWLYGRHALRALLRVAGLPLLINCGLFAAQTALRDWWGEPDWIGLLALGATGAVLGLAALITCDLLIGGTSPARLVLTRLLHSRRLVSWGERVGWARGRVR